MPIHFGTDGWRAVISDSFTFDNLRIVAQAIADAVDSEHWDKSAGTENAPDPKESSSVLIRASFLIASPERSLVSSPPTDSPSFLPSLIRQRRRFHTP